MAKDMTPQERREARTQNAAITIVAVFILISIASVFGWLPKLGNDANVSVRDTDPVTYGNGAGQQVLNEDTYTYVYPWEGQNNVQDVNDNGPVIAYGTVPSAIRIPSIGLSHDIEQPQSQHIDVLNSALDKGPVYYPGSGFVEDGNIFLFGHSSYLPVVYNKAYKAFNGLEDLNVGDEIQLVANGKTYIYSVERVQLLDADAALIDLSKPGRRLTLSTCNVFGQKSDRWVVDAVFKGVRG